MNIASRHLSIGIVDDREGDLVLLERLLRSAFHDRELTVVSSNAPPAASKRFARGDLDILFVDFTMGVTTGLAFLDEVRSQGCQVPAIMLTDRGDEDLVVSALHSGFADYLRKSALTERSLVRAATNAIEKHALSCRALAYKEELEEAVGTLEAKNKEISRFYHTLAHELKTPLTSAREFTSIVMDGIPGPINGDQKECLELAISSCDHLRRCIDDLFDVSRIDTGKLEVVREPCMLADVVKQAAAGLGPEAERLGVDLRLELEGCASVSNVDRGRIVQVVTNLIGNALKFTERGDSVVVRCREESKGFQRVSVIDSGEGIAADDLVHIFERLYQSDDNAAVKGGMGIGLHLCQQLVNLHGGKISATSVLGEGSTFSFTVPSCAA